MLQRLRNRAQGQEGFTLIELLVVILIIGILAAVAIPVFLNQTGKANDANVESDINSAQVALETYYTSNQTYGSTTANADESALETIDSSLTNAFGASEDLTVTATDEDSEGNTQGYTISAKDPSSIVFTLSKNSSGVIDRSCSVPAGINPAGCKLSGTQSTTTATTGTWGTSS